MTYFSMGISAGLLLFGLSPASAEDIMFINDVGKPVNLHVRVGTVGSEPDSRGSFNTSLDVGEQHVENVGDGDAWFAYGLQQIGGDENPALCHADGGDTVSLTETSPAAPNGEICFVKNL